MKKVNILQKNEKGFMFSIDAIIATISILALVGMWALPVQVNENSNVLTQLNKQSQDKAITGFYSNGNGTGDLKDADFGACNSYYKYDKVTGNLTEEKFCEKV